MLKKQLIEENERLIRELSMVCCEPNNYDSIVIIKREQSKYRLEKAIWMGDFEASEIQVQAWHAIEDLKERYQNK